MRALRDLRFSEWPRRFAPPAARLFDLEAAVTGNVDLAFTTSDEHFDDVLRFICGSTDGECADQLRAARDDCICEHATGVCIGLRALVALAEADGSVRHALVYEALGEWPKAGGRLILSKGLLPWTLDEPNFEDLAFRVSQTSAAREMQAALDRELDQPMNPDRRRR